MSWAPEYKAAPPYSPGVPVMGYQQQPLQMQQTGMVPMMAAPQAPPVMVVQPNMMGGGMMGGGMMGGAMMTNQQQCAQNGHSWKTEYGVCGIITAVVLFPVGLLAMLCDKKEVCRVCSKTA